MLLLPRQSLDNSNIIEILKRVHSSPKHKGGSKQLPKQYRLVSLTYHLIRIFERVVEKHILKHPTNNNYINQAQRGFVPVNSRQTQLLVHYKCINETTMQGKIMKTLFLD